MSSTIGRPTAARAPKKTAKGLDFPAGDGEMAALIRAFDWAKTPLGPREHWSQSLKMPVSFLLANRCPMLLWWGPNYISIYNDAYRPVLGAKHPKALGQPCAECWSEIWPVLKPLIDAPFQGRPATWMEDLELELHRNGFPEESHFTIACSPVPDDAAPRGIGGVLAAVHEITERVVGERRIAALRDLGARSVEARTAEQACAFAVETLAKYPKDVPFALIYLRERDGRTARLAGATGLAAGEAQSLALVELGDGAGAVWPLGAAVREETIIVVEEVPARLSQCSDRRKTAPAQRAVVVPIRSSTAHPLAGLLVAGVSARLRLDEHYRSFFELAAAQIAASLANARACEDEQFRVFVAATSDVIYRMSPDWTEMRHLQGRNFTADTNDSSRGWLEKYIHPDDRQRVMTAVGEAIRTKSILQLEHRVRRADGTLGWVFSRAIPLNDANGDLIEWLGAASNVTERKETEQALREREEQLRLATDAAEVGLWDVDLLTDTLFWPPRVKAMFGISPGVPVSMADFYAGLHPADRERTSEALAAALDPKRRALYDVEYRTVGKEDHLIRWVAAKGRGIFDSSGKCVRVIGTVIDITARKRTEERLSEETRVQELLGNVSHALVAAQLDIERVVRIATAAATELSGAALGAFFYNVQDERGESFRLYTLSGAAPEAFARFPQPRNTAVFGPTFRGEAVVRSPDITADPRYGHNAPYRGMPEGHLPVRSYLAVPVKTASGEVLGGLFFGHPESGVFDDRAERLVLAIAAQTAVAFDNARLHQDSQREIEHRRRIESHLANLLHEREQLLEAERTARAEAEAANRLKDEFLATVSHELRTPLSSVVSWGRVLQKLFPEGDEQLRRGLSIIVDNARLQAQIISDLLDMSRIAGGKIQLERTPANLRDVVENAIESQRPAAALKGIDLSVESTVEPAIVEVDVTRLQQVLWNLLSNAIKFTPEGGRVSVQLRRAGDWVELIVRDSGIGIPESFLPHVFDRFRQADSGTGRRFGGLGLGLAIVKQLVELHGGSVQASSAGDGYGAAFTVRLPLQQCPSAESFGTAAATEGNAESVPRPVLGGMRILVVEDDPPMLELLIRVLTEYGASVTGVSSAPAALDTLRSAERFALMLSDIGLPGMDGYELLRTVRAAFSPEALPAIAVTAFARDQDRALATAAGFQAHVTKPYEVAKLVGLVRRLGERG